MRLRITALWVVAVGVPACSSSTSNIVCESSVCGLGPTLFVRGVTRTAASVPIANVPIETAAFIAGCGTTYLAEYTLVPPTTASDGTGNYLVGIEPKRERSGVCLRLRAIHGSDSIVVDTNGLDLIPPPATAETLTVNFVFP